MATDKRTEAALDKAVDHTFPASDAPEITPQSGVRLDLEPLRTARPSSMPLRLMLVAGLQAAHGTELGYQALLEAVAALAHGQALRAFAAEDTARSGARLDGLRAALAQLGAGRGGGEGGGSGLDAFTPLAREVPSGPVLDLALALVARMAVQRAAATYDALQTLVQRVDAPDIADAIEDGLARTRAAAAALTGIVDRHLVPEVDEGSYPALPKPLLQLVFGGRLSGTGEAPDAPA